MSDKPVYVVNGPNLNLLGAREPEIYGADTLADLEQALHAHARGAGLALACFQSNHEGVLIDRIHEAAKEACAIVINAGGLSHTSVSLHDALRACGLPVIEVHLSHLARRESWRRHSRLSAAADGVIYGLGTKGYMLALDAAVWLARARRVAAPAGTPSDTPPGTPQ